jgi:hypothetical protein
MQAHPFNGFFFFFFFTINHMILSYIVDSIIMKKCLEENKRISVTLIFCCPLFVILFSVFSFQLAVADNCRHHLRSWGTSLSRFVHQ